MKRVLRDHGDIIHWTGGRGFFPVRSESGELGFASHGALNGRTPIGWHEFFPVFDKSGFVVVLDEEENTVELMKESDALSQLGEAARPRGRVPLNTNPTDGEASA